MKSANALAENDGQVTRNWRTDGSVVELRPRTGRNGTIVDELVDDDPQRPRPLQERAVDAVAKALRYDQQPATLRESQDGHAERLDTLGVNGKKMHLKLQHHKQRLNVHRTVLRENRAELLRLDQELMVTNGMCVQNQDDLAQVSQEVSHHGLEIDRANLRIDMERDSNLLHRAWINHHEARVRNIEQALRRTQSTKPLLSGFDWKPIAAWVSGLLGVGMVLAHFLH